MLNETHIHGHWEVDQRRLDIFVQGTFPQPDAHGIVGQSYQDTRVRMGKLDDYDIEKFNASAITDSNGMLPQITTSAQAEGAIEGVYTDYRLENMWATNFKYSAFEKAASTAKAPGVLRNQRPESYLKI